MSQEVMELDLTGEPDLYTVRGIALGTAQALQSHEKMDDFRFKIQDDTMKEIKNCIEDLTRKVEEGFKRNDNRFWSLGITFITLLISCCGFLIWEIISRHG